ncbi:MAG: hypothetical protein ABH878_05375 [bacterium]
MRKICLIACLGIFGWLLLSCDLFSTRSVEDPLDSGSPWIYPIQVEQVFANMMQAVSELNSVNYMRCFFEEDDPNGTFIFIPRNIAGWPVAGPWGYSEENQTIQNLFSLSSTSSIPTLILQEQDKLVYGNEDSVRITELYTFSIPISDANLPEQVSGRSDFYLARNSTGYWAIYRWEDLEGSPSWTDLKAALY